MDLSQVIAELAPSFNSYNTTGMVWWTATDLYEWADELAQRLARMTGVFVEYDAATALVTSQAVYNLPARHLSTLHVSAAGTALHPTTVHELEALDDGWASEEGIPVSFLQDGMSLDSIRLFPAPDVDTTGQIGILFHTYPSTITAGAPTISAPECLRPYFSFGVLAAARGRESQGSMPEVAKYFDGLTDLVGQAIQGYWGGSQ